MSVGCCVMGSQKGRAGTPRDVAESVPRSPLSGSHRDEFFPSTVPENSFSQPSAQDCLASTCMGGEVSSVRSVEGADGATLAVGQIGASRGLATMARGESPRLSPIPPPFVPTGLTPPGLMSPPGSVSSCQRGGVARDGSRGLVPQNSQGNFESTGDMKNFSGTFEHDGTFGGVKSPFEDFSGDFFAQVYPHPPTDESGIGVDFSCQTGATLGIFAFQG